MLRHFLKNLAGARAILQTDGPGALAKSAVRRLKFLFGSGGVDEVGIVHRLIKNRKGVMIDVGAHVGGSLHPFIFDGWRVYAFEPDPKSRLRLGQVFGHFEHLTIDARAVSEQSRQHLPFYQSDEVTSALSPYHESHEATGMVETIGLGDFCRDHHLNKVDFLKIDAEGHDLSVLKSLPLDALQPDVIVCEFMNPPSMHDMAKYLADNGYGVIVSEWHPIKAYGSPHQWRGFKTYPCEVHDEHAWGNLVAIRDEVLLKEMLVGFDKHVRRARS